MTQGVRGENRAEAAHRRSSGFTLLELLVALMIGSVAVTAAVSLLLGIADRAQAIEGAAARVDRDANAERLIRNLLGNLHIEVEGPPALEGDATRVRFRAWCETALGYPELCSVQLFFRETAGVPALALNPSVAETTGEHAGPAARTIELWSGFQTGGLMYLMDADRGGTWTGAWSSITLPLAVGVVLDADTLILPVR